jgi:DNA mismatch repair protein PMS2
MIKQFEENVINKLCANSTISNVSILIKEIIDNSIDAESNNIKIELKNNGVESICIIDNGSGIAEDNFENLCIRGATSKLESFNDIFKVKTHGFRGQALAAISCLCDLSVITKTKNSKCYKLNYNSDGVLVSKAVEVNYEKYKAIWNNNTGTCIKVDNIFKSNNLRFKVMIEKQDQLLNDITNLIQAYAIINTQINFKLFSENDKGKEIIVNTYPVGDETNNLQSMLFRVENIYGKSITEKLLTIEFENEFIKVEGFISKDIQSGSKYNKNKAIRYYYVNGRSINKFKKVDDIILNIYRKYNKDANPVRILSLFVPEGAYDINMNETKDDVILLNEKEILKYIEAQFNQFHEERIKILSANPTYTDKQFVKPKEQSFRNNVISQFINKNISSDIIRNKRTYEESHDEILDDIPIAQKLPKMEEERKDKNINNIYKTPNAKLNMLSRFASTNATLDSTNIKKIDKLSILKKHSIAKTESTEISERDELLSKRFNNIEHLDILDNNLNEHNCKNEHASKILEEVYEEPNIINLSNISLKEIKLYNFKNNYETGDMNNSDNSNDDLHYKTKNISLSIKSFDKANFSKMKIIGQFNTGFILTKYQKDIYIIDQHAADEKKTYEELYNNFKIDKQPLISPKKIDTLSIAEKHFIIENREIFEKLGFNLRASNNDIAIHAYPSVYSYKFEYDDFLNIFKKLEEGNYKLDMIDKEEIKKLFLSDSLLRYIATKACRSSVMIGTSLDINKMKSIVANLSKLFSPWNCPHGRPTMRFLFEMNN